MGLVMHDLSRGTIVVTAAQASSAARRFGFNRRGLDTFWSSTAWTNRKNRPLVPLRFADYIDADEFEARAMDGDDFGGVETVRLGACSGTRTRCRFSGPRHLRVHEASWRVGARARYPFRLRSSAATYGALEEILPMKRTWRVAAARHVRRLKTSFDLYAARGGSTTLSAGSNTLTYSGQRRPKGSMRSLVDKAFGQIVKPERSSCSKAIAPISATANRARLHGR